MLLGAAVVGLVFACVLVLPAYVVDRDLTGAASPALSADKLLAARNDVRTTLLQALGGAFFIATAFFTWRQIRISQRQLQVSEDEQVASRFTRAIEQLGSDKLDMRLGGIYALERIAWDSRRDHGAIVEVLTAFVRERVPWPPIAAPPDGPATSLLGVLTRRARSSSSSASQDGSAGKAPTDVQAVLTVLGRRNVEHERGVQARIDLCSIDLRGANLRDANLAGVLLNGTHLEGADLRGTDLRGARLVEADLEKAHLREARLEEAKLIRADLRRARLVAARLERAELMGAHLEEARLNEAHLEGAKLKGAHLEGTYLAKAVLAGATGVGQTSRNAETIWPDGFDPHAVQPA